MPFIRKWFPWMCKWFLLNGKVNLKVNIQIVQLRHSLLRHLLWIPNSEHSMFPKKQRKQFKWTLVKPFWCCLSPKVLNKNFRTFGVHGSSELRKLWFRFETLVTLHSAMDVYQIVLNETLLDVVVDVLLELAFCFQKMASQKFASCIRCAALFETLRNV